MNNWKEYDYILFDLDNTLLDFANTSKKSFFAAFAKFGMELTLENYDEYNRINAKYWHYFEQQKIDANDLRVNRFKEYLEFAKMDIEAALVSDTYEDGLINYSEWLDGAELLWQQVSASHKCAIITNGLARVQRGRLEKHKIIAPYFISEEIGHSKPAAAYFEQVHEALNSPLKNKVLVVGDNAIADIKGASNFGYDTCFYNHKRTKKLPKEATFVVHSWV